MEGMKPILEVSSFENNIERMESVDSLFKVIKEMQYYGLLREQLATKSISEHQLSLCLYNELVSTPRYTLHIVDSSKQYSNKFAIFIAPQGRETDWLFSTEKGRQQLSQSAEYQRLVIVTLDRNHSYDDLANIQSELSGKVMELAPPSYKCGAKVPFLSLGNDIGIRNIRKRYTSTISGDCVVEDVQTDNGQVFRRLIFVSNQNLIQSEAKLIKCVAKQGKKNKKAVDVKMKIDRSYLACQHHVTMIGGLAFATKMNPQTEGSSCQTCLIIGLGGGALPVFIHQHIPHVDIDVVDIDPTIVDIAKDWFGFKNEKNLTVYVANGIDFIQSASVKSKKWDVIMLDVDSKDTSLGLSCPPSTFLEEEFLNTLTTIMSTNGVLVLNLVCRDEDLKKQLLDRLKLIFPAVFYVNIEEEVNDIIFGLLRKNNGSAEEFLKHVQAIVKEMNISIKCNATHKTDIDLVESMTNINIG